MTTDELDTLATLWTEGRHPHTDDLDTLGTRELLELMNREDQRVALAVKEVVPQIAEAVELVVAARRRGGRLIYLGAGTSGRIGLLDAVECPPTFGTAIAALEEAGGHAKTAIVMLLADCDAARAAELLDGAGGDVRAAVARTSGQPGR